MARNELVGMNEAALRTRIRLILVLFVIGLVMSGLTAFPLKWEVSTLARWMGASDTATVETTSGTLQWIVEVRTALIETDRKYPFLAYGTDWLAFGHLMIAIAFIGAIRDPVRNIWIIEFGMIACVMVIPLALICGPIRGIPFYWRLIDCSFGVVGIIPLWIARNYTLKLAKMTAGIG